MRFVLPFFLLLISSCASNKKATIDSRSVRNDSSVVAVVDTGIVTSRKDHDLNIVEKNKDAVISREISFDNEGNPVRIFETYSLSDFERYDLSQLSENFEWLSGMSSITTSRYSHELDSLYESVAKKDSRAVQGREWIYLLFGVAALAVLYALYRKNLIRIK